MINLEDSEIESHVPYASPFTLECLRKNNKNFDMNLYKFTIKNSSDAYSHPNETMLSDVEKKRGHDLNEYTGVSSNNTQIGFGQYKCQELFNFFFFF
jgi:hypothetical protein